MMNTEINSIRQENLLEVLDFGENDNTLDNALEEMRILSQKMFRELLEFEPKMPRNGLDIV